MVMDACTGVAAVRRDAQKAPQSQTVRTTPGNAALAVQTFKVADKEHPEINPRRNPGTATVLIVFGTEPLGEVIEAGLGQHLIDFAVKTDGRDRWPVWRWG